MERSLANANSITTVERVRLSGRQVNCVIDDSAIDRSQILYHKVLAFAPDTSVTPRHLGLRIEPRQINLGKDI